MRKNDAHNPDAEAKREVEQMIREGNRRARRRSLAYWGGIVFGIFIFAFIMVVCSILPIPPILGRWIFFLAIIAGGSVGGLFYKLVKQPGDATSWGDDA